MWDAWRPLEGDCTLVLLPFAWFVTSACMQLIDGTDPDVDTYSPNYQAPNVYSLPTGETRFVGSGAAGTDVYCVGGQYRSGGAGSTDSIKNGLRREVDEAKNRVKQFEDKANACRGRIKTAADYEREAGCSWGRLRELGGLINAATSAAEAQQLRQEQNAMDQKCRASQSNYYSGECADHNVQGDLDAANFWRGQVAYKENQLRQFEACDADRQRQARAQRPGIDPNVLIFTNPGLFGPRRPHSSGSHGTGTPHKE